MPEFTNQSLKFHSDALAENTLVLTKLRGSERLSGPFRFELELVSSDANLDLEGILYEPAQVGIQNRGRLRTFRYFNGVLSEFHQLEQGQGWVRYRAVLVPAFWKLTEFYRSRIFQDVTLQTLVTEVLTRDLSLADGQDFELKLARAGEAGAGDGTTATDSQLSSVYPEREYVVQYEETDFDFVSRWLEHEGVFYFFENDGTAEKVVFADAKSAYKPTDVSHSSYPYRPQGRSQSTGGAEADRALEEEILSFGCTITRQPKKVTLSDYNWRDPSNPLHTKLDVSAQGEGVQNEYNDHFKTVAQGDALAQVRAEEWACRAKLFEGISTCPVFRPGRTFELEEHFRGDWNAEYVLVAVEHEAEQAINLQTSTVTGANYQNRFVAIPADQEFRPERTTSWPAIKGIMHARIDGPADSDYAQLDPHGRYKVKFPYDQYTADAADPHAASDGAASRWVRMSQPYAGVNSGMHFPLLKGTEVLVTHVDGDPDRPVISGAVPNLETVSPVDQGNPHQNRIQTSTGNTLVLDDDENMSGFVLMDASGRYIEDHRHPNQHFGSPTPGGGGGGAPRGLPLEDVGPGLRMALRGGIPLPAGLVPAPPGGGGGGQPDLGADPTTTEDGSNNLGAAGAVSGLAALLYYHPDHKGWLDGALGPVCDEGAPLDGAYNFKGKIFPNVLDVAIGSNKTKVAKADAKFDFFDYPKITTIYKGFQKLLKHDGNTKTKKETTGNREEEDEIQGDSVSKSTRIGTTTSESTHIGAAESKSTFMGTKKSESLSLSSSESQSITMGTESSTAITMSAKDTTSISLAAEESFSLTMSSKDTTSITMAAESSLSLTLSAKDATSITLAAESSLSLTLAAESKTDITIAAKDNTSVTVGLMNLTSIEVAGKNETKLTAGAFMETSLFAGVKMVTSLSAAIIQENTLAGGTKIEVTLAGGGVNTVKIPADNDVGLASNSVRLQKGFTTLMTSVTSAMTKLGI